MRITYKMIQLLAFALLIWGCDDDFAFIDRSIISEEYTGNYKWKYPLSPDTAYWYGIEPYYFDNLVFMGSAAIGSESGRIAALTADSGKAIWINTADPSVSLFTTASYLNYVLVRSGTDVLTVDMFSGEILWTNDIFNGVRFSSFGNKVYTPILSNIPNADHCSLVQIEIETGEWKKIFEVWKEDGYSAGLLPPTAIINKVWDTLLVFQNRQWNFTTGDGQLDLYCYNLSADSVVWMQDDFDPVGLNGALPPLIYNGNVYFLSLWTIYCCDLTTGELKWQHTFGENATENFYSGFIIPFEDNIIVKTGGEMLYSFDCLTGNENWSVYQAGFSASGANMHSGLIYYTGEGKIIIANPANGSIIKKISSPFGGVYNSDVVINPILNCIYASDSYYMYCYEIKW